MTNFEVLLKLILKVRVTLDDKFLVNNFSTMKAYVLKYNCDIIFVLYIIEGGMGGTVV